MSFMLELRTFWMFSVDTEVQWPSNELDELDKEPLKKKFLPNKRKRKPR